MGWKSSKGRGNFGGKRGASDCDQWGLYGLDILCREGWRRGSSQITLGFLVFNVILLCCTILGK